MLPPAQGYGVAVESDFDAATFLAASDLREAAGLECRGEQLEVFAEAEVVIARPGRKRHALEVDHDPTAGTLGDMTGVAGETVREVDHGVGVTRQLDPFLDPQRRAHEALFAEGRAGGAERAGDDDRVAGPRARTSRDTLRPAERGDREEHLCRLGCVAAADRHS